jgi:hypothetical protein
MMAQKQQTLAHTALDNPHHRFTNLYSLMHWRRWIEEAAKRVLARPGSSTAGVDGKTRDVFRKQFDEEITHALRGLPQGRTRHRALTVCTNLISPMESRMWGNSHVRFGERGGGIHTEQSVDGAPVPTLRDPTPSKEDVHLTRQLVEGGRLLGLRVHDHVIIGHGRHISLAQRGLV